MYNGNYNSHPGRKPKDEQDIKMLENFRARYKELSKGKGKPAIANAIGISPRAINSYFDGTRNSIPSLRTLWKMAECFDCSIDYLVGKSDYRNIGNKEIHDITGLSDSAIEKLISFNEKSFMAAAYDNLQAIEFLILNKRFTGLARCIHHAFELFRKSSEQEIDKNLEILHKHGVSNEELLKAEKLIMSTGDMIMSMNEAANHYAQQGAFVLQSMITEAFDDLE